MQILLSSTKNSRPDFFIKPKFQIPSFWGWELYLSFTGTLRKKNGIYNFACYPVILKVNDSAAKEFIMLEKLSPSLLNQLYGFLTNGNEDICLSTTRLRAENSEKATGSPLAFGITLLKMNLLYRLPFLRSRKADASDGIPEKYRRRRVQDFISPAAGKPLLSYPPTGFRWIPFSAPPIWGFQRRSYCKKLCPRETSPR